MKDGDKWEELYANEDHHMMSAQGNPRASFYGIIGSIASKRNQTMEQSLAHQRDRKNMKEYASITFDRQSSFSPPNLQNAGGQAKRDKGYTVAHHSNRDAIDGRPQMKLDIIEEMQRDRESTGVTKKK